uniref:Glycosyltransferase N-terminal domain-containing protein n=1 Tax=Aegilops tauschii subsp. strangulata TaxID=200361 RepID=A0A453CNQ1_AEGTS
MEPVAVVAVPFPAQGHLNQLLHLSLQLASRRVDVHYAAPAQHIWQARARVHGWGEEALHSIQSRPRHPQLRLPAPGPHRRLALPLPPHAHVQGLHRRRARPARGSPRQAFRLLPPHSRSARPHQRLRRRGGRAAAQRRVARAALLGRVHAPWKNGCQSPATARERPRLQRHRGMCDQGVRGVRQPGQTDERHLARRGHPGKHMPRARG